MNMHGALWARLTTHLTTEEKAWGIDEPCFYRLLDLASEVEGKILVVGGYPGIDVRALLATRSNPVEVLEREGPYLEKLKLAYDATVFSSWEKVTPPYSLILVDGPTDERARDFVAAFERVSRGRIVALHDANRTPELSIILSFHMNQSVDFQMFLEGRGLAWCYKP